MAAKNTNAAVKEEAPAVKKVDETKYSVDEFARAAENVFGFGTSPDIVRAALNKVGGGMFTKSEALKIVETFANKEVK